MGFWNKLFGGDNSSESLANDAAIDDEHDIDAEEAAIRSHVIAEARKINKAALKSAGLRAQMWVMTSDGVGILSGCNESGEIEVSIVKEDGRNKVVLDENDKAVNLVITTSPKNVRAAHIGEIPVSRYESIERLVAMGYKHGGQ